MSINFDAIKCSVVCAFEKVENTISRSVDNLSYRINSVSNFTFYSSVTTKTPERLNKSTVLVIDKEENFEREVEQTPVVSNLEDEAPVAVETSLMKELCKGLGEVELWLLIFPLIYFASSEKGENKFRNTCFCGDSSQGGNGTLV
ncbi:MAG: hypothetical protein CMO81_01835 [Waddliaceae bacterium]|nr:hypothetical protein [Waddliaceae bacterium]